MREALCVLSRISLKTPCPIATWAAWATDLAGSLGRQVEAARGAAPTDRRGPSLTVCRSLFRNRTLVLCQEWKRHGLAASHGQETGEPRPHPHLPPGLQCAASPWSPGAAPRGGEGKGFGVPRPPAPQLGSSRRATGGRAARGTPSRGSSNSQARGRGPGCGVTATRRSGSPGRSCPRHLKGAARSERGPGAGTAGPWPRPWRQKRRGRTGFLTDSNRPGRREKAGRGEGVRPRRRPRRREGLRLPGVPSTRPDGPLGGRVFSTFFGASITERKGKKQSGVHFKSPMLTISSALCISHNVNFHFLQEELTFVEKCRFPQSLTLLSPSPVSQNAINRKQAAGP